MKSKKNQKKIVIITILILFGLLMGIIVDSYLLNKSESDCNEPDYIKTGVVTLIFTLPDDSSNQDKSLLCSNTAYNGFSREKPKSCSWKISKYFNGEIDCVCKL